MDKEFVTYEQALALKELGFKEDCLASYYHAGKRLDICEYINHGKYTILAPLKQQVFRWFREKYELFVDVYPLAITASDKIGYRYSYVTYNLIDGSSESDSEIIGHYTYEEAENACIDKLIEIAKQQDHD